MSYSTFKRSATNFRQFGSARKTRVEDGLTYDEARQRCQEFNQNLSARQRRNGTKLEFTATENL